MTKYYNTTRGPIAVSLSNGKSLLVLPKTWGEIDAADEGSPDLASNVRKKFLVRSKLNAPPQEDPKTVAVSEVVVVSPTTIKSKEKEPSKTVGLAESTK